MIGVTSEILNIPIAQRQPEKPKIATRLFQSLNLNVTQPENTTSAPHIQAM
nr:hypothetical protein [uncultured Kingella sp.]